MHKIIIPLLLSFLIPAGSVHLAHASGPRDSVIVMLGDSLTAWGDWRDYFPGTHIKNFGIPGDTSGDIRRRLDPVIAVRPSKIFIMAGANDLWSGRKPAHAAANMEKIISELKKGRPRAKLYLQSMLPVNNQLLGPGIDNREVADLNGRLKSLAEKYGITFIDLTDRMGNGSGQLRKEFTRDGVHLSPAGYEAWQSVIRPFMAGD